MIIFFDFSIYDSPTSAYGRVSGEIEVSSLIKVGDGIQVLEKSAIKGFEGKLRVTYMHEPNSDSGSMLIGLEDVVLSSTKDVISLTRELSRAGFFVDPYHT